MSLLFSFPGYESIAKSLMKQLKGFRLGDVTLRHFPDGESFVKLNTDVQGKDIILICGLDYPDHKVMPFLFFTQVARELGAKGIGLVAPYLGYMRQDKRFHEGEAITSKIFAGFISQHIDWLVTVDPHLHRHKSLSEIYTVPTRALDATGKIAEWIVKSVERPLIIGPDEESLQWVREVSQKSKAPFVVLSKERHGDRDVKVSIPKIKEYKRHTPILVDDIISTGQTMIETIAHLKKTGLKLPVCIGIHGVFAQNAYENLLKAGVEKIVTCNTILHPSNAIDITSLLGGGVGSCLLPS